MSAGEGRSATISLLVSSHSGRNAKPPEITDRSGDYTHEREARLEQDVDTVVAGIREHRKKKPCPSSLIADPDGHMVFHAAEGSADRPKRSACAGQAERIAAGSGK